MSPSHFMAMVIAIDRTRRNVCILRTPVPVQCHHRHARTYDRQDRRRCTSSWVFCKVSEGGFDYLFWIYCFQNSTPKMTFGVLWSPNENYNKHFKQLLKWKNRIQTFPYTQPPEHVQEAVTLVCSSYAKIRQRCRTLALFLITRARVQSFPASIRFDSPPTPPNSRQRV